jgi:hypothetical protein
MISSVLILNVTMVLVNLSILVINSSYILKEIKKVR